jgi:phage repressor protein C with HTH and peptisase S24 domain
MAESDPKCAIARSRASFLGVCLDAFMSTDSMLEKPVIQENPALAQEILVGTIPRMNIHRRIKERRELLGLSMEALASLVGVKAWQTVQQWEREDGGTAPKRERLKAVADALKTTPEYLLFGQLNAERVGDTPSIGRPSDEPALPNQPIPLQYQVSTSKFRRVLVVGRAQGGLPERIWTDGDYPVGATDEYAEIATNDPHAFLVPVIGTSMVPRFNPGEFAFVEPGTEPELEDDVLVRLLTGETMIKKLVSRRGGIQLSSYNEPGSMLYQPDEITWMYYVAHPVPARKIKTRM